MKMFLLMCLTVIISFCTVNCEPTIGDIFGKIPDQLETAWSNLKAVIKEPIRPARIGKIGMFPDEIIDDNNIIQKNISDEPLVLDYFKLMNSYTPTRSSRDLKAGEKMLIPLSQDEWISLMNIPLSQDVWDIKLMERKRTTLATQKATEADTTTSDPSTRTLVTNRMPAPEYFGRSEFVTDNHKISSFEQHGSQSSYRVYSYDYEESTLSDRNRVLLPHLAAPVTLDIFEREEKQLRKPSTYDYYRSTRTYSPNPEVFKFLYGSFTQTPYIRATLIED